MSPHFGRCPSPDNLIQIESGPSLENLSKELEWSTFYKDNTDQILKQSMYNNTFDGAPLGGNFTRTPGFDYSNAVRILSDIHPRSNSTEEKRCDSAPNEEHLKKEASNEESFNVCYIITGLLLLALIITIICKLQGM